MKIKIRQIITTTVLSFSLVMFSVQGPATAAPTLKAQLQTLVKKADATWPKIGSYSVMTTEVYFYNDQLKYTTPRTNIDGSQTWFTLIREPKYSYNIFPSNFMQSVLKKLNIKRLDWIRYDGGFESPDTSGKIDAGNYKRFFRLPIDTLNIAFKNPKSISLNKKTGMWSFQGNCEQSKLNEDRTVTFSKVMCMNFVSFNKNGSIRHLGQNFPDNSSGSFEFDKPKPTGYFVDHLYVLDSNTGMLAEY